MNIKLLNKLASCSEISLTRGKAENWACGIIYAIGQLNFLFEQSFEPYVHQDRVCSYFGATKQTIWKKARDIRRLLKLKLNDKEFTSKFVLTLNIPDSDDDLNRIRTYEEVRCQIRPVRPSNVNELKNTELENLLNEVFKNSNDDKLDELLILMRTTLLIKFNLNIVMPSTDNKYAIPLFTNMDKFNAIPDKFNRVTMSAWPFYYILINLSDNNFDGVVINPKTDNYFISREMINKIYPNRDKINYIRMYL